MQVPRFVRNVASKLVRDGGECGDAESGLRDEDESGECEEEFAVAGFEDVGEDASGEGEEEGQRP
jgi:hypothetical protein